MKRAAAEDSHLLGSQVDDARLISDRVEEHREGAEDHDGGHGHSRFVRLRAKGGFGAKHGRSSADARPDRRQKRDVAVHLEPFAHHDAAQDCHSHDDAVDRDARKSHFDHLLECQPEAVEDDAQTQHALRAILDSRCPRLRKMVAEGVGINHTEDDADDQRREGDGFQKLSFSDEEGGAGEERHEEHAVKNARFSFLNHVFVLFLL